MRSSRRSRGREGDRLRTTSGGRSNAVRIEDRLHVAKSRQALLEGLGISNLDHELILDHRVLGRAAGAENVDPRLGKGAREILEQPGSIVCVDLQLDPI